MRQLRFAEAIFEALSEEMSRDSTVILMGEDVRAGVYRSSRGLVDKFGEWRIIDTPISEAGYCGAAIGAAMAGLRPVAELQLGSFVYLAMEQIANEAAKIRHFSGGQAKLPITFRVTASGGKGGYAAQHSDNVYPAILNAGLKTVLPSNSYDAKGLLKQAIRDNDPVVFIETAQLASKRSDVPEEEYTLPLGKANVVREGKDVTVVAVGYLVNEALKCAADMEQTDLSIEIIDPRTLFPLDTEAILQSVAKTGRIVIADDSNETCGFAAEVAAVVAKEAFWNLDAPIIRVSRPVIPVPNSKVLEAACYPQAKDIAKAVHAVMVDYP